MSKDIQKKKGQKRKGTPLPLPPPKVPKRKKLEDYKESDYLFEIQHPNKVIESEDSKGIRTLALPPGQNAMWAYTDGSCVDRKENARTGSGIFFGFQHPLNRALRIEGRQTSTRTELVAAQNAVLLAKSVGAEKITIFSDCALVVNGYSKMMKKWKKKGWKTKFKQPVKDKDELLLLESICKGVEVSFVKVKAHTGLAENESANILAFEGASKSP